jgi:Tfp pilus assembly protein PilO
MKKIILTIVININSKKTKKKIYFRRKMNFNNINKWGLKMKIIIIIILK